MWRALLLLSGLLPVLGWAAPVVPDRPGFSTGTATVPPGAWQAEMGIQSSYGPRSGDPDSYTAPLLNLRTGLTASTEFNLLWDGIQVIDGSDRNSADVMLGTKHRLVNGSDLNVSLLGYVALQEGRLAPFLGLLWDHEVTSSIGLFGTLQVATVVEAGHRQWNFQPALGVSFTHGPQWSSFVEIYADRPLELASETATVMDAGLAWLPRKDVQLDINFGMALDNRSEDFVGTGVALRF